MKKINTFFLIPAAILFIVPQNLSAQVNVNDSLALVDFYNSTDGPHWDNNHLWLTKKPLSLWYGVTVTNNRVTGFNMGRYGTDDFPQGNNITGEIPKSFWNLTELTHLDFELNHLKGRLSNKIGKLKKLTYLDFNGNKLSGKLPSNIGKLVNLVHFDISFNKFSDSIPPEIGNLINLTGLFFPNNQFSGSIPSELGNLVSIKDINLSKNNLSGNIPPKLSKLFSTIASPILSIENNNFAFGGLVNLIKKFPENGTLHYSPQANIPLHQNNNILSVYTGGAYQLTLDTFKWYNNGSLIATIIGDSTFTPSENGNYSVAVTNAVATELTLYSDTINYVANENFIASNIKSEKKTFASVFPNPFKTNTTLTFTASGNYIISIVDINGKTLQTINGVSNKTQNAIVLNLSQYASGVYMAVINDEKNDKKVLKLYKE
ncbi:MAG: T9SS type A sorting domain-containing protein [Bacteroidetes bacterium]|nr:T9SS type A sorting domain-containing protein [Bacteroidota bacterium]